MSLELTPALEERLQHFAVQSNRTPEDVAQEAVESFLTSQDEWAAFVKEGDDDFENGDFIPHEEVFARLFERIQSR